MQHLKFDVTPLEELSYMNVRKYPISKFDV